MSTDSSSSETQAVSTEPAVRQKHWFFKLLGYSAWVALAFVLAYILLIATAWVLRQTVGPLTQYMSVNLAGVLLNFILYGYMIAIIIGVPRLLAKKRVSLKTLGIAKPPRLRDIPVSIIGMIGYYVAAAALLIAVIKLVPGFDAGQEQDVGVSNLLPGIEMYFAFALLVIIVPFVEELIFRGYLFGNFERIGVPVWVAILVTSALFGLAHMQWNVGLNVFVLSIFMCLARQYTGSIWAGVLMHMIKNGIAFYLLFVA